MCMSTPKMPDPPKPQPPPPPPAPPAQQSAAENQSAPEAPGIKKKDQRVSRDKLRIPKSSAKGLNLPGAN